MRSAHMHMSPPTEDELPRLHPVSRMYYDLISEKPRTIVEATKPEHTKEARDEVEEFVMGLRVLGLVEQNDFREWHLAKGF